MKIEVVDRIVLSHKGKVTSFMNYLFRVNSRLSLKNDETSNNLFVYKSQVYYTSLDDDIREEQREKFYDEFLEGNELKPTFRRVYADIIYLDMPGLQKNQDFLEWINSSEFQSVDEMVNNICIVVDENFYTRERKPTSFCWVIHLDQEALPHIHRIYCLD